MLLTELLITLTALLPAQPARFGTPACDLRQQQELADRSYFVLCHDAARKVPTWVGYELKWSQVAAFTSAHMHRPSHFRPDDELIHTGARDADYRNSGYSRGHMAPTADFAFSTDAMKATFVLSNAAPQLQSINAGVWSRLENRVRRLAALSRAIYVFTGPIFEGDDSFIGASRVAVPSHFYKVVLAEQDHRIMYAAIVPNTLVSSEPLDRFLTTVDEVERRTGLDFFSELEKEEQSVLESSRTRMPE